MIVLYSQLSCPQCRMVHMLLEKNNIDFTEVQDISVMQEKGINHTPAIEVDGNILQGKQMMDYIKGNK